MIPAKKRPEANKADCLPDLTGYGWLNILEPNDNEQTTKMMIRTFIAIPLSKDIHKSIDTLVAELRAAGSLPVRWVRIENIHVTLKFLGDVDERRIPAVSDAIAAAAKDILPFQLSAEKMGVFPDFKRPRIVWVGSVLDRPAFELYNNLERNLKELGFEPEDRAFRPHLTVGRVARDAGSGDLQRIGDLVKRYQDRNAGQMTVHEIVLFKSDLLSGDRRYSRLASVSLTD